MAARKVYLYTEVSPNVPVVKASSVTNTLLRGPGVDSDYSRDLCKRSWPGTLSTVKCEQEWTLDGDLITASHWWYEKRWMEDLTCQRVTKIVT